MKPTSHSTADYPLIHSVKEMAAALKRSEDYVQDMKRGGFELPATLMDAVEFIREKGPPGKFRGNPTTRFSVYRPEKK